MTVHKCNGRWDACIHWLGNSPENSEVFSNIFAYLLKLYFYNNLGFLSNNYSMKGVFQVGLKLSSIIVYCFLNVIYVNTDANSWFFNMTISSLYLISEITGSLISESSFRCSEWDWKKTNLLLTVPLQENKTELTSFVSIKNWV